MYGDYTEIDVDSPGNRAKVVQLPSYRTNPSYRIDKTAWPDRPTGTRRDTLRWVPPPQAAPIVEKDEILEDEEEDQTHAPSRAGKGVHELESDSTPDAKGGMISSLLRITGRSTTMRQRTSHGIGDGVILNAAVIPGCGSGETRERSESIASSISGVDELDDDDPRITGLVKKRRGSVLDNFPFIQTNVLERFGLGKKRRVSSIKRHVTGE